MGHPQRRPRPLPLFPHSSFSPPPDPAPATAPAPIPPQIGRLGVQCSVHGRGPLAAACGTGRRRRHSLRGGPTGAAALTQLLGGGAVRSRAALAAAPTTPFPRDGSADAAAGVPTASGADAAAGRLRGTVASDPPAAPRHRGPLTPTYCTGRRRVRCCWADLPARRGSPNSAPAPSLLL